MLSQQLVLCHMVPSGKFVGMKAMMHTGGCDCGREVIGGFQAGRDLMDWGEDREASLLLASLEDCLCFCEMATQLQISCICNVEQREFLPNFVLLHCRRVVPLNTSLPAIALGLFKIA